MVVKGKLNVIVGKIKSKKLWSDYILFKRLTGLKLKEFKHLTCYFSGLFDLADF